MNLSVEADPKFLNRLAWNVRWSDRRRSTSAARSALTLAEARSEMGADAAAALRTLSWQAKWRGDFDGAMEHALACEALVTEADAPDLRGDCYSILGVIHYSRHRLDLAQSATQRGLSLDGLPDTSWIDLMTTQATIQRYMGHHGKAGITLMRARERATGAELARVEHNLARWMAQHGDADGAITHADTSIALSEAHGNRVILPYAHEIAGEACATLGRDAEAARHFRRGTEIAVEDDDMRVLCQLLYCSATFEAGRGDHGRALDQLSYGARIAEDMDYPLWQKKFALSLAEVLEATGDLAGALEAHKSAWALNDQMRDDCIGATPRSG